MVYFCKKNYRLTSSIRPLIRRFATYLMVYRRFGYQYSPVHYILSRRGIRIKRFLKRTMKQAESGV
jgi:hypothetical protein